MIKNFTHLATGGARGGLSDSELERGFKRYDYPEDLLPQDADLDRRPPPVVPPVCCDWR